MDHHVVSISDSAQIEEEEEEEEEEEGRKEGMGASLEALAMAGADYVDSAIDFDTLDEEIPPYLLAIDHEEDKPMDDEKKKKKKKKKKKMGTSLESLAMAGADYVDHAIDQGKEYEDVKQIDVGKKMMKKKKKAGMGASLDALAMAGADYVDSAIDFDTLDEEIPPYLLAIDHEEDKPMDDETKKKKMGTSLEALAMAGADYVDHAIDQGKEYEDVKQIDVGKKKKEMGALDEDSPPCLWAANKGRGHEEVEQMDDEAEEMKALLLLWAKMVASSIRRKLAD